VSGGDYVSRRIATVTDPAPVVPSAPWPIGTRMTLEGEEGPWGYIEVCGLFEHSPDLGVEPVVRPVSAAHGHDCSPRKASPDAILSLGYEVEDAPAESEPAWETDSAEVSAPFDTHEAASQ